MQICIFVEKHGIAGKLAETIDPYGVALYCTRGFNSISRLHEIALDMAEDGRDAVVFNVGDDDGSGHAIMDNNEAKLRKWAPGIRIVEHRRLAITPEQVREYRLPTRPRKLDGPYASAKRGRGGDVDVDALAPPILRGLVTDALSERITADMLEQAQAEVAVQRQWLAKKLGYRGDTA